MKKKNSVNPIFYLILIIIPIVFFIILEGALSLFNYGVDTSTWVKASQKHYGLNPDVAKRYFYTVDSTPQSIQDIFSIEKRRNTYRVFVMGGSSAAGYPFMPLGSFSRYIRQRLEHSYPEMNIEVVNLGLTAVNTYTIRDLVPDVLEQNPDLILFYAGHNEYYGALGIGSLESLGKSRKLVNFVLDLNKFKTTQLVRDIIQWVIKSVSADEKNAAGTLMSRMAEEQSIPIESEIFNLGIEQFEGNFRDILTMITDNGIPVIVSTLASNIKDQPPFISDKKSKSNNAKSVYVEAKKINKIGEFKKADSLFRLAKDLDQLRFRAPEKINLIIKNFGKEFSIPVVDADSILSLKSPNGIIGNNYMTDHLHLNLKGYQDLGELFYTKISESGLLPASEPSIEFSMQDSITRKYYKFSKLDSTIADFKLKILKNDWPFTSLKKRKKVSSLLQINNIVDSMALKFVNGEEEWERAHRKLATHYLQNGEFEKVLEEFNLLIHQYPSLVNYNNFISNELIKRKRYVDALEYLERGNKLKPDAYYSKWLGIINLSLEKVDTAIIFLEKSLKFKINDPQVLFNLSGAYSKKQLFEKALNRINKCLDINPNYNGAKVLKSQLESIVSANK